MRPKRIVKKECQYNLAEINEISLKDFPFEVRRSQKGYRVYMHYQDIVTGIRVWLPEPNEVPCSSPQVALKHIYTMWDSEESLAWFQSFVAENLRLIEKRQREFVKTLERLETLKQGRQFLLINGTPSDYLRDSGCPA